MRQYHNVDIIMVAPTAQGSAAYENTDIWSMMLRIVEKRWDLCYFDDATNCVLASS